MDEAEARALIAEGEERIRALVAWRSAQVEIGRAYIESANRVFDEMVVPVQREIDALRRELAPEPPAEPRPSGLHRTLRRVTLEGTEDWTEEERAHFVALVTGNK